MAKNKITVQMLSDMMASNSGNSKTTTETFVKNFFSVLKEALQKDNIIKIKGFGTFKLVVVAARESVNVNTGERVSIAEYNKITFTPDKSLKTRVNKPFEQFDTILIENEDVEMVERVISESEITAVNLTQEEQSLVSQTISGQFIPEEKQSEEQGIVEPNVSEDCVSEMATAKIADNNNESPLELPVVDTSVEEVVDNESTPEDYTEEQNIQNAEQASQASEIPEDLVEEINESQAEHIEEKTNNEKAVVEQIPENFEIIKTPETQQSGKRKALIASSIIAGVLVMIALIVGAYILGTQHIIDFSDADKPAITENNKTQSLQSKSQTPTNAQTVLENEQTETEKALSDSLALLREKAANYEQVEDGEYLIVGTKTYRKMSANTNLTKLTLNVYGDTRFLPYVIKYNGIKNPDRVVSGTRLRFPELIEK